MDRQQTGQIDNLGSFGFYDAQHLQLLQGGTNYLDENLKSHVISSAETVPCAAGYKWLLSANDSQPADCYNGYRWELGSVGEEMMCKGRYMETCVAAHKLPLRELDISNNTVEGDMSSRNCIGLMSTKRSNISDFFSAGNGASASNYISPLNLLHGAESSPVASGFDNIASRNPNLPLAAQYWGNCDNSTEPNISWNQQDAPSLRARRSTLLINNQAGYAFPTSVDAQSEGLPRIINTTVAPPADHDQMRQTNRISSLDYSYSDTDTAGYSASVGVLRSSKYLRAAQQILEEICNIKSCYNSMKRASCNRAAAIGVDQISDGPLHMKEGSASTRRINQMWMSGEERCSLQMKKARLIGMVEELDQRYQQYQDEMQLIVTSFESATGMGAAAPYTALAKKLISRQFRALRDAIREHIHGACSMLGEDISSVPILNKGETPRLRILEKRLRHHRMLQQVGVLSQHQYEGWRPQRSLPERCVAVLRAWLFEHFLHPYPKDSEKLMLARLTGLTRRQVANWFINARVRIWKPMVEKMYADERKEAEYRNQEGANRYGSSGGLKGTIMQRRSVMTTKHGVSLTLALQNSSVVDQLEPNIYRPNHQYCPVLEDTDYNIMNAFS